MENDLKDTVIYLYKQNRWRDILHLDINSNNDKVARNLLWVWPSIENFDFMKALMLKNNVSGLTSIGCGCGLLEWMFREYTKMDIIGYEINREWWTSKYSVPTFINLIYSDKSVKLNSNYALLFCYFNDGCAFREYVRNYGGNLIFIIGPGKGRGTHTEPQPFQPNFENNDWILNDYQEVKDSKDFIAAYIKKPVALK